LGGASEADIRVDRKLLVILPFPAADLLDPAAANPAMHLDGHRLSVT
jgi:hypothetical protein